MNKKIIYKTDVIDLLKKWADGYRYIEIETELAIKEFECISSAQPEIIYCKNYMWFIPNEVIHGEGMCDNPKAWVGATCSDFGCIYAEWKE